MAEAQEAKTAPGGARLLAPSNNYLLNLTSFSERQDTGERGAGDQKTHNIQTGQHFSSRVSERASSHADLLRHRVYAPTHAQVVCVCVRRGVLVVFLLALVCWPVLNKL